MEKINLKIGKESYSIEKRVLEHPTTLNLIFEKAEEEGLQEIDVPESLNIWFGGYHKEYINDIIQLMETGRINERLLSIPRMQLKMLIQFFDLPFYAPVLDYPNELLGYMFYNQWYRTYRYKKGFSKNWDNSGILVEITDDMVEKIRETTSRRCKASLWNIDINSNRPIEIYSKLTQAFQKISVDGMNEQFGSYSKNILTRFQYTAYFYRHEGDVGSMIRYDIGGITNPDKLFDGSVIVAGGSVVDRLSGCETTSEYQTDMDFFFIGITQEQAEEKISKIAKHSRSFFRSKDAITFVNNGKRYQFIFRIYKDVEEVLMGFDLDASAIAYDGERVVATQAAMYCLKNRVIPVDFSRMSTSFSYRIIKYAKYKVFSIYVPKLTQYSRTRPIYRSTNGLNAILAWHQHNYMPHKINDYDDVPEEVIQKMYQAHKRSAKFNIKSWDGSNAALEYIKGGQQNAVPLKESIRDFPISWKTINPGEQTTGTYNKVFYSDPEAWYTFEEQIPEKIMQAALGILKSEDRKSIDLAPALYIYREELSALQYRKNIQIKDKFTHLEKGQDTMSEQNNSSDSDDSDSDDIFKSPKMPRSPISPKRRSPYTSNNNSDDSSDSDGSSTDDSDDLRFTK